MTKVIPESKRKKIRPNRFNVNSISQLPGVILGQNCIQLSNTGLNYLFFSILFLSKAV